MDLKSLKLSSLSRTMQLALFGLLVVLLAGSYYYFLLRGQLDERDRLRGEVLDLERSVAQTAAVASQLERFRKELDVLEQRLKDLRSILPSEKETPQVLRSAQEMAASSSLKISRFQPMPVVPHPFYSDWPILIEVRGSYNALGDFFEKISRATRIINVENVVVRGIDGSMDSRMTLSAACYITTFVYREDLIVGPEGVPVAPGKKVGGK